MNLFKRLFGKPNYKMVFTCNCTARRSECFGLDYTKVDSKLIIKVDEERKKYKCYVTDGDLSCDVDPAFIVASYPKMSEIFDKFNMQY